MFLTKYVGLDLYDRDIKEIFMIYDENIPYEKIWLKFN